MYLCCVFLLGCLDDWLKGVQYGVCVLYVCHVFCQLLSLCTYSLGGFIFILIFAQSYLDLLLTSGVFTWRYCNSFSACLQCCEVPQCFLVLPGTIRFLLAEELDVRQAFLAERQKMIHSFWLSLC